MWQNAKSNSVPHNPFQRESFLFSSRDDQRDKKWLERNKQSPSSLLHQKITQ
jgi:hypothetical protein